MTAQTLEPQQADEYARHLSQVNKKNQVLATEDIFNEQGALLVKKGTPLSEQLAERVIRHKLTQPLEHSVNLSNMIDAGRLRKGFEQLFEQYPDCRQVHQELRLQIRLEENCREYTRFPLLMQKLTVLAMQRPHDYQKGLFCAWMALALGQQMQLETGQVTAVFLAGLMHDTGMLHISTDILEKEGELTTEEWRAIQSHPRIGELFLRNVPGLAPEVARATLEHHERRDGTGYPGGRFAESLSTEGQVIAIADSLCAIRMLRLSERGGNLASAIPILQINVRGYDPDAYRAAVAVIRAGELRVPRLVEDARMPAFIDGLLAMYERLNRCFAGVSDVVGQLPEESPNGKIRSAALLAQHAWFAVASSGLLSQSLKHWISLVKKNHEQDHYANMEEVDVLQQEVRWQLVQLRKALNTLHSERVLAGAESAALLELALESLQALDTP
ncbi:HD-GYP domain-containing protein [Motiliproteus sp. SC1-56]|uniref:HD-GYP domain-containing protein n=1 Tax=Motiliproteus sp. SC1-56 TaxID=2799565 RepID=UPI001A8ED74C|nr:HD domain-containing phosphohydrolase [Motiliproteus sp. SC1-56]